MVYLYEGKDQSEYICGYNLATKEEFQIQTDASPNSPKIYEDVVVWEDYGNDSRDIFGYRVSTKEKFQITTNKKDQGYPAIYGDIVVWEDSRNGGSDIYGCNLLEALNTAPPPPDRPYYTLLILVIIIAAVIIILMKRKGISVSMSRNKEEKKSKIYVCPQCKNRIWRTWNTCPYCGTRIRENTHEEKLRNRD